MMKELEPAHELGIVLVAPAAHAGGEQLTALPAFFEAFAARGLRFERCHQRIEFRADSRQCRLKVAIARQRLEGEASALFLECQPQIARRLVERVRGLGQRREILG